MSLTTCLKRAGSAINAEDKAAILKAAAAYRKEGMKAADAGRKAVDERIAAVQGMLAEREQAVADGTAEQPAQATHADPGEAPEAATQAVVTEAIKTAAENRDRKPSEMRAELLRMVDEAISKAGDEVPDGQVPKFSKVVTSGGRKEFEATMVEPETGLTARVLIRETGDKGATAWALYPDGNLRSKPLDYVPDKAMAEQRVAAYLRGAKWSSGNGPAGSWTFRPVGAPAEWFTTFKVPGDGTFKVLNTKAKLQEFRDKVAKSSAFNDRTPAPTVGGDRAGGERGYGGNKGAITGMIDEGDPQAAVDYAAARGLDIAEVLKGDKARLGKVAGLTPTEAEAVGEFEPEAAPALDEAAQLQALDALDAKLNRRYTDTPLTQESFDAMKDAGYMAGTFKSPKFTDEGRARRNELQASDRERSLAVGDAEDLAADGMPFKASAVDQYGMKVPDGYVRDGDMFMKDAPAAQEPAEPSGDPGEFVIAERKAIKRGTLEGGATEYEYIPDERLGRYASRQEAKAAFMRKMDPALAAADDARAAKHFDQMARNEGTYKVVKAPAAAPAQQAQDGERAGKAPATKIADFGEKLEGARKDYATTLKDAEAVDVAAEPLSKSWPEPDYQKLLDNGVDPYIVALVRAARDEVPTKPQKSWKLKGWVETVKSLRETSRALLAGEVKPESARRIVDSTRSMLGVKGRAELYELVGHGRSLKGVTLSEHHYSWYKGENNVTKWAIEQAAKATAFGNWPRELAVADTKEEALRIFKEKIGSLDLGAKAKGQPQFVIYRKRGQEGAFIGKKIGREYIDLHKAADVAAAREYMAGNVEALEKALEAYKSTPLERKAENQPRVGDDHRNGAPVTPEVFADTFGFRGVQFGNYVEQGRRQSDLNEAFDGLMDLAAVLGVPPRALSLNGQLGLAFGARGRGGRDAPGAHYEPGTVVINLTKGGGPGALAHEWWHAADNYFAKQGGGSGYMTGGARADQMRDKLRQAFATVKAATSSATYQKRAAELDKRRSKPYWNTPIERSARAFESYIIAKLQDQGASNDYLANVVSEQFWNASEAIRAGMFTENAKADTYPYPLPSEMPSVRAAFDEFFKTVETRTDDAGNVAMFRRGPEADAKLTNVQQAVDTITATWANPPEVRVVWDLQDPAVDERIRAEDARQRRGGATGTPLAVYDRGTVYIVASAAQSDMDVARSLFHEGLGHAGLRAAFGDSLKPMLAQMVKTNRAAVEAKAREYGLDMGKESDALRAAEEVLAELAETRPTSTWVKRAISAIRQWLRDNLPGIFGDMELSDADIVARFIVPARDAIVRGKEAQGRNARPMFMRDGADDTGPFYSALTQAIQRADMKAAGAQGWRMFLKGQIAKGAVKQDEVTWSGVEEWLDMQPGKVSREAVAEYLRANGVRVTETVLSDNGTTDLPPGWEVRRATEDDDVESRWVLVDDDGEVRGEGDTSAQAMEDGWDADSAADAPTKYAQYTLPGGTNYREVLLTLPVKTPKVYRVSSAGGPVVELRDVMDFATREEAQAELESRERDLPRQYHSMMEFDRLARDGGPYRSTHWDQPNILAHIRLNDRTDAEGKRVLFVEEIQSDWAQEGKKKGFKEEAKYRYEVFDSKTGEVVGGYDNETAALRATQVRGDDGLYHLDYRRTDSQADPGSKVPPAPFVDKTDKWVALALKRVIKMAVDEGYDRVAFVTGEQSAERYDLSKQIEAISYVKKNDGTYNVEVMPKGRNREWDRTLVPQGVTADRIADYVGKEIADKIQRGEGREEFGGRRMLFGLDLKVGGEGMRAFYDKIVPAALKDVLRKVGGGELARVNINTDFNVFQIDDGVWGNNIDARTFSSEAEARASAGMQQPGITITPAMREKASSGLPLFRRGGADAIREVMPQAVQDRFNDAFTSQRGFNRWWHRTVGTQLHKAKVNKEFGRVYYAVQDFMKDVSRIATRAADQAPDLLPQIETLKDIAKKPAAKEDMKAASTALFDGTLRYKRNEAGEAVLAGDDELGGMVWSDDELRERGLSDAAIQLYRQARAAIDTSLDNMLAADIHRMVSASDMRALAGNQMEAEALLARVRKAAASDDPRSAVRMVRQALQERIDLFDAQLEANDIGEQAETIKRLRDKVADALQAIEDKEDRIDSLQDAGYAPLMRFGQYTVDVLNDKGERVFFGMYESQMAANMAARKFREQGLTVTQGVQSKREFELLKGLSPETAKLFAELLGVEQNEAMQEWLKNAVAEQSALKRHIRRKGIEGFDDDASRVVAAFLTSNARAASRALHSQRVQDAVASVTQGDVKDEAIALADYVNNPTEEAQAIRSLLFVQYIGGSVASAAVNLTQTFVQTFPFLAQYGGMGKAGKRIAAAMKDALGKIEEPDLAAAIKQAESDGVIKPQEVFQLQAEASRTMGSNIYVRKGLAAWGALFQLAEQYNRRVAFIAAYRTAKEQGIANPFAFAENAVDETQSVFNKANRPNWSRGAVGATLFTFKTFTIQYLEFLSRLPMEQRVLALAVLVLLSGARGLPFGEDAEDVVDTIAQQMGYNWTTKDNVNRWLVRELGQGWADFIQNGFSGISGVPLDVSQRLGMADLLPATGVLKPSETRKEDQVLEAFGVAGSAVRDTLRGEVRPLAIRNVAKAVDMYDMGMYRDTRGRKITETDAVDAILKGIGFQPSNVAREQRAVGREYEKTALYRKVKNDITERMALGRFEGDKEKIAEAREARDRWNEQNPDAKIEIDGNAVLRRVAEMRKSRRERFVASAPKDIRKQTAEALQ